MAATSESLTCRGCGGSKPTQYYLCKTCWWSLPTAARTVLNKRDARAFRRLSDLYEQLRAGVPVNEIEIADE